MDQINVLILDLFVFAGFYFACILLLQCVAPLPAVSVLDEVSHE